MRFCIVKNGTTGAFFDTLSIVEDPKLPPGTIVLRTKTKDYVIDTDGGVVHEVKGKLRFESHDPECGDLMTWKEFVDGVRTLSITDDDGHGEFATEHDCSTISVTPGELDEMLDGAPDAFYPDPPFRWATHVVWYNK